MLCCLLFVICDLSCVVCLLLFTGLGFVGVVSRVLLLGCWSFIVARCSLFLVHCSLFVVCCLLCVDMLFVVSVIGGSLFVARCAVFVCSLFVIR